MFSRLFDLPGGPGRRIVQFNTFFRQLITDPVSRSEVLVAARLQAIPGFGPVVSSAVKCWMGDGQQFRRGVAIIRFCSRVPSPCACRSSRRPRPRHPPEEQETADAEGGDDRAEGERARSAAIGTFLESTLRGASPHVSRGRDTALLEAILDEYKKRHDDVATAIMDEMGAPWALARGAHRQRTRTGTTVAKKLRFIELPRPSVLEWGG